MLVSIQNRKYVHYGVPNKWIAYSHQVFVIFACFGYVVINHQKGGDCKENGPQTIWLNRFWCLMINITCGLMCLLVFMFIVHRMLKLLGLRH